MKKKSALSYSQLANSTSGTGLETVYYLLLLVVVVVAATVLRSSSGGSNQYYLLNTTNMVVLGKTAVAIWYNKQQWGKKEKACSMR